MKSSTCIRTAALLGIVGAASVSQADGVKMEGVTVRAATDAPRATLVVDAIRPAKGRGKLSARVVGHIPAWGKKDAAELDPNRAYTLQRRYTFETYSPPESRAGKWVLATRYWNACWKSTATTVILARTDLGYFERFCRTPANLRKLSILQSKAAARRYREQAVIKTLQRDLADPDLFIEALRALHGRRRLRVADVLRALRKMPQGSNADPLQAYARLLKDKARLRYWQGLLARLRRTPTPAVADYLRRVFNDRNESRPLIPAALKLYTQLPYQRAGTAEMVCDQLWPIVFALEGHLDKTSRRGITALLAHRAAEPALRKACKETVEKLRKLVQTPKAKAKK